MIVFRQPFRGDYLITQKYGEVIPGVTYQGKPHTGIDYGCPDGTEILASADGVVKLAEFDNSGYGYVVIIRHNDGRATLYAHLGQILCHTNQSVKQGNIIGTSGSTGNVTGPHLHFEARKEWYNHLTHFNPMDLPLTNFSDAPSVSEPQILKGAGSFKAGDLVKVQNPIGVKAFLDPGFSYDHMTTYQQGTPFYYTGECTTRKDNGLTYMRVAPALFSVWIAVNDGETQLLDK